jgi:hypothetical protein
MSEIRQTPAHSRSAELRTPSPPVEDVSVDHRRGHVAVTQQLLHRADIVTVLQQVGGERVPQAVAGDPLRETGIRRGQLDGALDDGLVEVVATKSISAFRMLVQETVRQSGSGIPLRPAEFRRPIACPESLDCQDERPQPSRSLAPRPAAWHRPRADARRAYHPRAPCHASALIAGVPMPTEALTRYLQDHLAGGRRAPADGGAGRS